MPKNIIFNCHLEGSSELRKFPERDVQGNEQFLVYLGKQRKAEFLICVLRHSLLLAPPLYCGYSRLAKQRYETL